MKKIILLLFCAGIYIPFITTSVTALTAGKKFLKNCKKNQRIKVTYADGVAYGCYPTSKAPVSPTITIAAAQNKPQAGHYITQTGTVNTKRVSFICMNTPDASNFEKNNDAPFFEITAHKPNAHLFAQTEPPVTLNSITPASAAQTSPTQIVAPTAPSLTTPPASTQVAAGDTQGAVATNPSAVSSTQTSSSDTQGTVSMEAPPPISFETAPPLPTAPAPTVTITATPTTTTSTPSTTSGSN